MCNNASDGNQRRQHSMHHPAVVGSSNIRSGKCKIVCYWKFRNLKSSTMAKAIANYSSLKSSRRFVFFFNYWFYCECVMHNQFCAILPGENWEKKETNMNGKKQQPQQQRRMEWMLNDIFRNESDNRLRSSHTWYDVHRNIRETMWIIIRNTHTDNRVRNLTPLRTIDEINHFILYRCVFVQGDTFLFVCMAQ